MPDEVPEAVQYLRSFLEKVAGSSLGAWLRHFDRDNDQRIQQGEFMYILQDLGYDGDAKAVFNILDEDRSGELSLEEVDPEDAHLWNHFRAWCAGTFKKSDDMLWRLGGKRAMKFNAIGPSHFCQGVVQLGWTGGHENLLFSALDIDDKNRIRRENLKWLAIEIQRCARKEAAKQQVLKHAQKLTGVTHQVVVLEKFKAFLKRQYGGCFRAWRSVLSSPGAMTIRKRQFFKACAEVGWTKEIKILWKAFGKSENSYLVIDELDLPTSETMACFRDFICARFGSASAAFSALDTRRKNKVYKSTLSGVLALDKGLCENSSLIFHELRQVGNKHLTMEDFGFLDAWKPLAYLLAKPNHQAAELMKGTLIKVYKNYVKAWRRVLDTDGSNHCTWDEFAAACQTVGFEGDVGGAWRALDADLSGSITLEEIDATSHHILQDFRIWASAEFGSVKSAFSIMDGDRSGCLSLKEWRRALRIYGYQGAPVHLFRVLDVDASNSVSLCEMSFLDGWQLPGEHREDEGSCDEDTTTEMSRMPLPLLRELEKTAVMALDVLGEDVVLHHVPPARRKTQGRTAQMESPEKRHSQHQPRRSTLKKRGSNDRRSTLGIRGSVLARRASQMGDSSALGHDGSADDEGTTEEETQSKPAMNAELVSGFAKAFRQCIDSMV